MSNKKDTTSKPTNKPKKKKNYLNKRDMLAELKKCHEADEMTPEFARMITLLADRYGSRFEYADYAPHIDDMKAVAVMNVVRAWRSFDLERFDNPFAYFTQAIKHTFWQYVHQEKKHRLSRDHLLIENGELPSDAFIDDIEKELTSEKMEEIMDDIDEETDEERYEREFNKRKFDILPESQKPGEIISISIEEYEREQAKKANDIKGPTYSIHSDISNIKDGNNE